MIYCCDTCRFVFERTGTFETCPDCGKPSVREATTDEKDEYVRNRAARKDDDNHGDFNKRNRKLD